MDAEGPLVTFDDLILGYEGHPAVHHLGGVIEAGSLIAIVGPNGAGKSTLLKGMAGLLKPIGGRILRSGVVANRIAYLPQQTEIERAFPASVFDLVSLGLWGRRGAFGRISTADRDAIDHALSAVGLGGFHQRGIDTLSGGQMQRALFARVMLQDARLILLDEPFNAIDTRTVDDLIGIVRRWHGERRTVLVALHDLDLVRQHFPSTLLLARNLVAWGETRATLCPENLLTARHLVESWDEQAPWCDHRHAA
jgi:zinc/manganese transport system ATP-binding protein